MDDIKRFIKFLNVTDTCWLWRGKLDKDGYGFFVLNRKTMRAHRASLLLFGTELDNRPVDHLCRVRSCVRPDHLELVTTKENTMRSPIALAAVNSRKTHCNNGHEFTEVNTAIIRTTGERRCRTCTKETKKRFRRKRKALGLPYM